ncbi:hypothetical protein [Pelosinus propionicus]|uniref:Uncharacterized protein n=1 Tax=Pelosinus propionicus DSM 13327 TaxID=1123291 RepID=A0A1I4QF69_9FIRM|nr:hypothetical protein [Pelosinus propionicus]SFM38253.1 hypothetical protein SAMN04490355_10962 [Pelosinus propionicus DSM 13327]
METKNKIIIGLLVFIALGIGIIAYQSIQKSSEESRIKQQEQKIMEKEKNDIKKVLDKPKKSMTDSTENNFK